MNLKPVEPTQTVNLFPDLSAELISLLKQLPQPAWDQATACPGWTVKDLVAHLLGGSLGRLLADRATLIQLPTVGEIYKTLFELMDQLPSHFDAVSTFAELIELIDQRNAELVQAARIFTSAQLIEYLEITDDHLYQHFKTLPPHELTGVPVAWAGETQSPHWFDIAREYTEKWLHQQHIREAVDQPGLTERHWLFPVLAIFMRALPYTYRQQDALPGTSITVSITGQAGGDWSLLRQNGQWLLFAGLASEPSATIKIDQDLAWRLFTKGVSLVRAKDQVHIVGDQDLGLEFLHTVSIMA